MISLKTGFFFYLIFTCNIKNMITEYELRTWLTIEFVPIYFAANEKKYYVHISFKFLHDLSPMPILLLFHISILPHSLFCNEIFTTFNMSENSLLTVTHTLKKNRDILKAFLKQKCSIASLFNVDC